MACRSTCNLLLRLLPGDDNAKVAESSSLSATVVHIPGATQQSSPVGRGVVHVCDVLMLVLQNMLDVPQFEIEFWH